MNSIMNVKNIAILLACLAMFASNPIAAAGRTIVKTQPALYFFGNTNIELENAMGQSASWAMKYYLWNYQYMSVQNKMTGLGFSYKKYMLSHMNMFEGTYYSLNLDYLKIKGSYEDLNVESKVFVPNVEVGYSFRLDKKVVLTLSGYGGFCISKKTGDTDLKMPYEGLYYGANLSIGYIF
jgi:hypothetical protein